MRSALAAAAQRRAGRSRSTSLSTVPPAETSSEYLPELAAIAASILYRSPLPSREGRPVYILNAAAFPDAFEVDYDSLLSYVLARLPGEDELLSGTEYEVIFFAGGQPEGATSEKKQGPGMGWYLQAYHVLSRATRKKLQRLYIVHPRTWVRVLVGVFGTIVSPKFRRKIVHIDKLSQLALEQPIYRLLIPPASYLHDRKLEPEIEVPYASGKRAFGARHALPKNINTGATRLPRVLRETTSFLLLPSNIRMEGLFRIPPHSTFAGILKEAYDRGQMYIVWKERGATVVQPGMDQVLVEEVRLEEAYGIHLAASLVKLWYRELREPIFPESGYAQLRERYGSPDAEVTPENLVDLILPASPNSPLGASSRDILTRHLLPLLSEIAAHEPQNKMSAENLAICFSMCLVNGSDQMEDAKMSSVVRRILTAAIEIWPQLRDGMGMSAEALKADLQPPADMRDYEDPPADEDGHGKRMSEDDTVETKEGHRIVLEDFDEKPKVPEKGPTLPPRPPSKDGPRYAPSREGLRYVMNDFEKESDPKRLPSLPPRPPPHSKPKSRATSATKQLPSLDVTSPVKRKPVSATTSADTSPSNSVPPRYSHVFDVDGQSIHSDSPASYVSSDGHGARRPVNATYPVDEKKRGFLTSLEPVDANSALSVPKRKALSTESNSTEQRAPEPVSAATARSTSAGSTLARMAAQKAANTLASRMGPPKADGDSDVAVQSPESTTSSDVSEDVFRKPSWPAAAARQQTQPQPQPFTKPALPLRTSHTFPMVNASTTNGNGNGNNLAAPSFPKPRTPSPGLLARMSTMEAANGAANKALEPKKLNLKKASVDDLRRLYEERVNTAEGLKKADEARKTSITPTVTP